jgi:hypothetical protein
MGTEFNYLGNAYFFTLLRSYTQHYNFIVLGIK